MHFVASIYVIFIVASILPFDRRSTFFSATTSFFACFFPLSAFATAAQANCFGLQVAAAAIGNRLLRYCASARTSRFTSLLVHSFEVRARKKCKRIGRTRDSSEKAAFRRTTFEIIDVSDNIFSQVQRLMASQASCCDREKLISLSSSWNRFVLPFLPWSFRSRHCPTSNMARRRYAKEEKKRQKFHQVSPPPLNKRPLWR